MTQILGSIALSDGSRSDLPTTRSKGIPSFYFDFSGFRGVLSNLEATSRDSVCSESLYSSKSRDSESLYSSKGSTASSEVEDYISNLILREADLDCDMVSPLHSVGDDWSSTDESNGKEYYFPQLDGDGCHVFVVL